MNREKNQIKQQFDEIFKQQMKEKKYKFRNGFVYKKINNDVFVYGSYIFVPLSDNGNWIFRLNIKKYSYDDIFWEIMNMEENKKQAESFRAVGAFKVTGIPILRLNSKVQDNIEEFVKNLSEEIEKVVDLWRDSNKINNYVLEHDDFLDAQIMKVLVYIDKGMKKEALEMARKEVMKGNIGRFENEGKGFFERICFYAL